jgi:hypothetical protein
MRRGRWSAQSARSTSPCPQMNGFPHRRRRVGAGERPRTADSFWPCWVGQGRCLSWDQPEVCMDSYAILSRAECGSAPVNGRRHSVELRQRAGSPSSRRTLRPRAFDDRVVRGRSKRHELLRLWLDLLGEECKKLRDVASGGRGDDVRRDLHGPAHRPFPRRVAIAPVWAKPRWVLSPVPAPGASSPRAARLPMTQNIP